MIAPADLQSLQYVARNMCAMDAAEIFATRFVADPDVIALEASGCKRAYVCVRSGVPVSAFGVLKIWPHVWSVWMFSTENFNQRDGIEVVRQFKRVIAPALLASGAYRVQCDSLDIHGDAHAFIKRFGGSYESTMRWYGSNGETFIRFVWDRPALQAQVPKLRLARNQDISQLHATDQRDIRVVTGR